MSISTNLSEIQKRISQACARVDRDPETVNIVAVSKTVDAATIKKAYNAGLNIFGENRVQEAWQKYQALDIKAEWHMIGHLQTNKVKRVLDFADVIQSVDSISIAKEINKRAKEVGKKIDVFAQVNTSFEESKFGLGPDDVVEFLHEAGQLEFLNFTGLMTVGAFLPDPEQVRPSFKLLKEIFDRVNAEATNDIELQYLSMGMTNDFETAIEEGATHIRVGRALFGERHY